jgi:hypothetical protein
MALLITALITSPVLVVTGAAALHARRNARR